jgi:glycylpeptide N-tetradecanoyltransferase
MPAGFEWCEVDVTDPAQVQEVYNLLNLNYVEDDDCMFR